MSRDLRNRGFMYKYVVSRHGKDKIEWEYVLQRHQYPLYTKQAEVNRNFAIPETARSHAGLYDTLPFSNLFLFASVTHYFTNL